MVTFAKAVKEAEFWSCYGVTGGSKREEAARASLALKVTVYQMSMNS